MSKKQVLDKALGLADIVVETGAKNCTEPLSLNRKGLEVNFCQPDFKCNVQEHNFVFLWSNY